MAPIGVTLSLVERVDINFANIERMHFTEEVSNPAQIGCGFINRPGLRRLCPRSRYLMSGLRSARSLPSGDCTTHRRSERDSNPRSLSVGFRSRGRSRGSVGTVLRTHLPERGTEGSNPL